MKKLIYLFLPLLIASCSSMLESLEISNSKLSCLKKEKKNEYSAFGFRFKKKSDIASLNSFDSRCFKNNKIVGFSGLFEAKSLIKNTKENSKLGNSAILSLSVVDFRDFDKRYKTDKEFKAFVTSSINKREVEMKYNKNRRYSDLINKAGEIIINGKSICKSLFQSLKDSGAQNLPESEEYLVMNNYYKSCVILDSEIFVDMAVSVRATKDLIQKFDSKYLKNYITEFENNL